MPATKGLLCKVDSSQQHGMTLGDHTDDGDLPSAKMSQPGSYALSRAWSGCADGDAAGAQYPMSGSRYPGEIDAEVLFAVLAGDGASSRGEREGDGASSRGDRGRSSARLGERRLGTRGSEWNQLLSGAKFSGVETYGLPSY